MIRSQHIHIVALLIVLLCIFTSCGTTGLVPEGQYLLDKVSIKIDNKDVKEGDLIPFLRQRPNDPKLQLRMYTWAGNDSSWLKNTIRKAGTPPVIYNSQLTALTTKEIQTELKNRGYLHNQISTSIDTVNKKATVNYMVTTNEPSRIRNFKIDITDDRVDSILARRARRGRSTINPGTIFDMDLLETERSNISRRLRNSGYYAFSEDRLHYFADTTLRNNQVDITLAIPDSNRVQPYYIRDIHVYCGYDPLNREQYKITDSVFYKNIHIYYDSTHFLNPDILYKNILIRPGEIYSETKATRTYNYINALNCVSRTNVRFDEVVQNDSALLDCNIYITPGNIHGLQTGLDGTNKAGDLGIAANIAYTHHNLFNGAETFNVKLKGAYEFVSGTTNDVLTHNFYEFGIQTGINFPKTHIPFIGDLARQRFNVNTQYEVSFDIQKRPEYTRDFFNLSWKNRWENDSKTISQSLNILDINYVMMPWVSDTFQVYLNKDVNSLTKYSYENVFTAGISYNLILSNQNTGGNRQLLYTTRFNAESSGNLLNAIFSLSNASKSPTGQYNILGNPFAQYVKGDASYTQTIKLDEKNSLAWRAFFGVAYPYGNSTMLDTSSSSGKSSILPFEKRYYSGGPNSIRGWSTRDLGPGSYNDEIGNPSTHVGDIKLELNAEFRYKWIKWLELAVFADAGNIWTFHDYKNQQGGQFKADQFYKEIAIGSGVGLRLDLSFLIIRVDAAKRVHDPAREEGQRWTFFKEGLKGNSGLYFAIGYPF